MNCNAEHSHINIFGDRQVGPVYNGRKTCYIQLWPACATVYVPAKPSILAGAGTSDQVALGRKCDVVAAGVPDARVEFVLLVG